jgi:hypothetical protein
MLRYVSINNAVPLIIAAIVLAVIIKNSFVLKLVDANKHAEA